MQVQLTKTASKRAKQGYPLVRSEDLVSPTLATTPSNTWVDFVDAQKNYIATGYLAPQNKGIGWLVNWQGNVDHVYIQNCFEQAKARRAQFANQTETTAYRLFNGEGDGLGGVTIDCYGEYAVFSWYNAFIYAQRELLVAVFQQVWPEIKGASEKIRFQAEALPESQWLFGAVAPEPLLVRENGITYATYLNEGLMTGIFLDQKEVRALLSEGLAAGRSLLNMFSYTGAFSVAAAMGGARQTTSVDLAKRSLPKTQEQFLSNGLSLEEQRIVVMDVFAYFNYARKKGLTYDVVVLDPPSFARNKKKVFSVAKNYGQLVTESLTLLNQTGTLIASTNAANLTFEKYQQLVERALQQVHVRYTIKAVYRLPADFHVSSDFPEGNYLKVLVIDIKK